MTLGHNYKIDFNIDHSMYKMFGFEKQIYSKGEHRSTKTPEIIDFHHIMVQTNWINGSNKFY